MPTMKLGDPGVMEFVIVMNLAAVNFEGNDAPIIRRATRFADDLLWCDAEVEDFIDEMSSHLRLQIARPFMGGTVADLIAVFEHAQLIDEARRAVKQ